MRHKSTHFAFNGQHLIEMQVYLALINKNREKDKLIAKKIPSALKYRKMQISLNIVIFLFFVSRTCCENVATHR